MINLTKKDIEDLEKGYSNSYVDSLDKDNIIKALASKILD